MTSRERLIADYKGAFDEWALQVNNLQTAYGSEPGSNTVKDAEQRVEAAEIACRGPRDRLADDIIAG